MGNYCRVRRISIADVFQGSYALIKTPSPSPFSPLHSLWQDVEVIMAKHGLYNICFEELISVTGATDPNLG